MYKGIEVLVHSSIRIDDGKIIYIDPYLMDRARNDADMIFITHSHYDHFSPEDIAKVVKNDTIFIVPSSIKKDFARSAYHAYSVRYVAAGETLDIAGSKVEVVPSYNIGKPMHPKTNGWVGYIITLKAGRCYIAGDTDYTPDAENVRCDIALVPIGGTYTMDGREAAELVNRIHPRVAIPTHYMTLEGSEVNGPVFHEKVDAAVEVVDELGSGT